MAAVWGMENFLYGRHFILQIDKKPLVSIFKKKTQWMCHLEFRDWPLELGSMISPQIPGEQNLISYALSHVTPLELQKCEKKGGILAVNILQNSSFEKRDLDELITATYKDAELQALK